MPGDRGAAGRADTCPTATATASDRAENEGSGSDVHARRDGSARDEGPVRPDLDPTDRSACRRVGRDRPGDR